MPRFFMAYSDYISIKSDYAPCMTVEDINKNPTTWTSFYPHKSFVDILITLLQSLDGGNKSLWITGGYGTGKTYVALVLQKLFMDDESRVRQWFCKYSREFDSKLLDKLKESLKSLRKRRVLVIYDVNSDNVDAKTQFLMRLQHGITQELLRFHYTIPSRGALDVILKRIRQDEKYFFAQRDELQGDLPALDPTIQSVDDIEKELKKNQNNVEFISDIMKVLEARNIYLPIDAEAFLDWVNAIIDQNKIAKIVYIWDEFSSFINRNKAELKTLEQLGEAAQQGKLYFVPVTHMNIHSYLGEGTESAKKANDRFLFQHLEMPNNIAIKLTKDVLTVNSAKESEWKTDKERLWDRVHLGVVESYMIPHDQTLNAEDLKEVLPIHPMSIFMLKQFAVTLGSNQRSLFSFLNSQDFRHFLQQGSVEKQDHVFLTIDYLWSYFMDRDDLGISQKVQAIGAEYARYAAQLNNEETRVFKATLLFLLLEHFQETKLPELQSASVNNISKSFEGDKSFSQEIKEILKALEKKHCFAIFNDHCYLWANNSTVSEKVYDAEKILFQDTQEKLKSFYQDINYGKRFEIRVSSAKLSESNIKTKQEFSPSGNRILIQFLLAINSEEQPKITEKALALAKQFYDHRILFVTIPELTFCRDNAEEWSEYSKNYTRNQENLDKISKEISSKRIKETREEWVEKIKAVNRLVVYQTNPNGQPFIHNLTWTQLKGNWLQNYTKQAFKDYTDDLCDFFHSAVGNVTGLQKWAIAGMEFGKFSKGGTYVGVIKNWKKHGISDAPDWFATHPDHPLTHLHKFCKEYVDNTAGKGHNCSLRKLYIKLQQPPFGLVCIPHSAFVLGFVLKDLLEEKYHMQWTDNIVSNTLDANTLAEMIEAVVKSDSSGPINKEKEICLLTEEEKIFIANISNIFGGERLIDVSVETALGVLTTQLQKISNRVPLWTLPLIIQKDGDQNEKELCTVIADICEACSISSKGDTQKRSDKVKEVGSLLRDNPSLAYALHEFMSPVKFDEAFLLYVKKQKPELLEAATRIGNINYLTEIKNRFAATTSWLWKPCDTEGELEEVYRRLLCLELISKISNIKESVSFEAALKHLRDAVFTQNKIPLLLWKRQHPALDRFFDVLSKAPSELSEEDLKSLHNTLSEYTEKLQEIFFDLRKTRQMGVMQEVFGSSYTLSAEDWQNIYDALPQNSAIMDEHTFKTYGVEIINKHTKQLFCLQVQKAWYARTGSENPDAWSAQHNLPVQFLVKDSEENYFAEVNHPDAVPQNKQQDVLDWLAHESHFLSFDEAKRAFIQHILPKRYHNIHFDILDFISSLQTKLGNNPNRWLTDSRFVSTVDECIKEKYEVLIRTQALEKAQNLSDAESKAILLSLIDRFPDVGLSILERKECSR